MVFENKFFNFDRLTHFFFMKALSQIVIKLNNDNVNIHVHRSQNWRNLADLLYSIGWSGAEWQSLAAGGGWGRMITDLSSHFSQDNNY